MVRKMKRHVLHPFPGDIVTVMFEACLWEEPFDDNPHAGVVASVKKGSLGVVVSAQSNDRLVMFPCGLGWTNVNNLMQVRS